MCPELVERIEHEEKKELYGHINRIQSVYNSHKT